MVAGRRWMVAVACCVAGTATTFVQLVPAQSPNSINVFVPADRSLRQHLVRASKAIEEERFSDAVNELGMLLANTSELEGAAAQEEPQDYFLDTSPQAGSRTSLKSEALRLLGTLPPRGRELYELQFGAVARFMLDAAIQENNREKLQEVVRRYFLTRAGAEATLLRGRLYLDEGQPLAAALCLKQLADNPAHGQAFEPELSVLLASCWYQAKQPERAQQVIADLAARSPRAVLQIGGGESEPLPPTDRILPWLEQHFGNSLAKSTQLAQWILFRGDETRNAESRGGVPLEGVRWEVPIAGSEKDRRLIEELQQTFREQSMPMIPSLQPLAVNNVILMRTYDALWAVDFETGKRVWPYPWDAPFTDEPSETLGLPATSERDMRKYTLTQRLWQDMPYGQVSSDGELVFLLHELSHMPALPNRPMQRFQMRGIMQFQNSDFFSHNQLVAVELKREGALRWQVGGETGMGEPLLAGVSFLGPPLPMFGQLYVLAEIRGEVRLIVLDAETGKQEWVQQLAHLEQYYAYDPTPRRLVGATPSFADGVLVCPTSAGAVVAVDVASRKLLWGYQYGQLAHNNGSFGLPYPTHFQSQQRWLDSTATISNGSVVLTPPESDLLICLDLLSGQPRWKPLARQGDLAEMLFVACVNDGKIVLVGKNRLFAVNLADGKPAWKQPTFLDTEKGEMPSGRGFLSGHNYYLPTTSSELLTIDIRTGQVVKRAHTSHVLGNLICFKDDVISLGPDRATASYQMEPLRIRVAKQLETNPEDAWALARQGELYLYDGKPTEALQSLQHANRLEPNDEGVRALLVSTFLNALRRDFAGHKQLAGQVEPLIEHDAQRIDYFMMLGVGNQAAGDTIDATNAYVQLARLAVANSEPGNASPFPTISPADGWSVRLDRFLRARLAELWRSGDSTVREPIDRLVRELPANANEATEGPDTRYLAICGFHPAAESYWLQHVEYLLSMSKLLEAQCALAAVEPSSNSQTAGRAQFLKSRLYDQAKEKELAAEVYRELGKRWADVEVANGKTGKQVFEEALAKGLTTVGEAKDEWPLGKVEVAESRDSFARQGGYRKITSYPVEAVNNGDRQLRLVIDSGISTAYVRDGSGDVLARLPDNSHAYQSGPVRAAADGSILFVNQGGRAMAVSMLRNRPRENDPLLWIEHLVPIPAETGTSLIRHVPHAVRIPFDPRAKSMISLEDASNRPVAVVGPMNRGGVCFQKVRTLTCVDALTGKPVWSRMDLDQGLELFGDEQFVIAARRDDQECTILDAVDGRVLRKQQLPPRDHRWAVVGTKVLAWEEVEQGYRLFLSDMARGQEIWSETVAKEARGCLVDQLAVAMVQPDGSLFLRSLTSDQRLVDAKLSLEKDVAIESVFVRVSRDEWLVAINDDRPRPEEIQTTSTSFELLPLNGQLYAFGRQDGKPRWESPAVIRGFSVPVEQPEDLPTLWLIRQYKVGQIGQIQSNKMDVVCLDRRTGGILLDRRGIGTQSNSLQVTAEVSKREVTLVLPQIAYTVRFTEEPRPPESPAQLSEAITSPRSAVEQFGRIVTSVTRALLPNAKPENETKKSAK